MKIGELGERVGVSAKTIRYYESLGLLEEPERTASGYRDYDEAAFERLQFVRDAQATGLTLAEVLSVLELKGSGEQSCTHTASLLERHLADLDVQIARLQEARSSLQELAARARSLDPIMCTDPNRCQVITATSET